MKSLVDIDPNFNVVGVIPDNFEFFDAKRDPFEKYGMADDCGDTWNRLPKSVLAVCNEWQRMLSRHMAGACVRFSTDANVIAFLWELSELANMGHFAASGQSGMSLFEETDFGAKFVGNIIPAMGQGGLGCAKYQTSLRALKGGMRHYVLYLPLYNSIESLSIGLPKGSTLSKGRTPDITKPLTFYGSSITQGGCASSPAASHANILARRLGCSLRNLGFSGNAHGEDYMANYIASLDMCAFVMEFDHNAPNAQELIDRHEVFFKTIRAAQPDLPIFIATRPDFHYNIEPAKTYRSIIMKTYANALASGDKNVSFFDGELFFGVSDNELCTIDGCHPTDIGFLRMANNMEPSIREALGLF